MLTVLRNIRHTHMENNEFEFEQISLSKAALKFYAGMIVFACIWMFFRDGYLFYKKLHFTENLPEVFNISFVFIFFVVFVSFLLTQFTVWGKESEELLVKTLGKLGFSEILLMALLSSIGEELLFRGAMQISFAEIWGVSNSVFLTSLIFGLFHPPVDKKLFYFPYMAFFLSLGLGWTLVKTSNILCPVIIHFGINFCNMSIMQISQKNSQKHN